MPTAIVKGAGPAGLAASIALAQSDFSVQVFEKRPKRTIGQGRRNVVALRPEGLRTLDELGALEYALNFRQISGSQGCITRMKRGTTVSEFDGLIFPWPLQRYGPAEIAGSAEAGRPYQRPNRIQEQVPSCFIALGDLEDCLIQVAKDLNVEILYETMISLGKDADTSAYTASSRSPSGTLTDLGIPDLIVCASGKNDPDLQSQLNIERHEAILLTADNLPDPTAISDPFMLRLDKTNCSSIERQIMSVFGIKDPAAEVGVLDHFTRKYVPDDTEAETHPQPVVEIKMTHSESTALLLQIPRSASALHESKAAYEKYMLSRINTLLVSSYSSIQEIQEANLITWGDPTKPLSITTSTAPKYVYGTNVILIGDCAMSCSPNSGIGAEIALTVDSASVKALAQTLATGPDEATRRQALIDFNTRKAESAVVWSQGSSLFYATKDEADKFSRNELVEEPKMVGIQRAIFGPLIEAHG